jgi:hypothetical protein
MIFVKAQHLSSSVKTKNNYTKKCHYYSEIIIRLIYGDMFQGPQWMPKTADGTELYTYCFLYIWIPKIEVNFKNIQNNRLAIIINNN